MRKQGAPKGAGKGKPAANKQQASTKKGSQRGPRMGNAMHAHSKMLIPTAIRTGDAFALSGIIRPAALDVAIGDRKIIGVTNYGSAGSVMHITSVNGINVLRYIYTIPLLAAADDAGGPTSARSMKAGLHLVNTSPVLNRCGRVYHLNGTARVLLPQVPSAMSATQWGAFADTLIAMPGCTAYEGDAFGGSGKQFQCNVVDTLDYENFQVFDGTSTGDEFFSHIAVWPSSLPQPRPMSTCWVVIESPALAQTYNPTASASFYTRWPLTSVPGQSMRAIPTADNQVINAMHQVSEVAANIAHNPIVEGIERTIARVGRNGVRSVIGMLGR